MALILPTKGKKLKSGKDCWFAPNATIVGDVRMGSSCTVWFSAVVRGDVNSITIGDHTNIQDNVTIHGTYNTHSTTIGNYVSIGHNAVVHGCTIEDNVLIGIGAVVLDGAIIKKGAIIGANAVVLAGTIVDENSIFAGIPAKKIKDIDEKNRSMQTRIAKNYTMYSSWFPEMSS